MTKASGDTNPIRHNLTTMQYSAWYCDGTVHGDGGGGDVPVLLGGGGGSGGGSCDIYLFRDL